MAIYNDKNDRLWFKIVNNGGFRFVRGVPPVHGCFGGNPFIVPSIHHTRFPEATWPTRSIKTTCHSLRFAKHTIPLVILKWLAGKGHFFRKIMGKSFMNYMIVSFQMAFFWSPKGIDKTIHVSWLTLALGRGLKSHHPEWPTKGFTKRREKGATGGSGWRCLELFTCTQATSRLYWFWINVYRIKILETYQLYEASRCYPYKGHRKYGNDGVHAFYARCSHGTSQLFSLGGRGWPRESQRFQNWKWPSKNASSIQ